MSIVLQRTMASVFPAADPSYVFPSRLWKLSFRVAGKNDNFDVIATQSCGWQSYDAIVVEYKWANCNALAFTAADLHYLDLATFTS